MPRWGRAWASPDPGARGGGSAIGTLRSAMGHRIRGTLATASSAPWRRAPWLLWRRPGVLVTVAGACAVLVAAVAAVPVFLSSVASETVALQIEERCPRDTGASRPFAASPTRVVDRGPDPFAPLADRLQPSSRWVRQEAILLSPADDLENTTGAALLTRDDVLDHVEVLAVGDGPGVWISDRASELTGVGPGGVVAIGG